MKKLKHIVLLVLCLSVISCSVDTDKVEKAKKISGDFYDYLKQDDWQAAARLLGEDFYEDNDAQKFIESLQYTKTRYGTVRRAKVDKVVTSYRFNNGVKREEVTLTYKVKYDGGLESKEELVFDVGTDEVNKISGYNFNMDE